MLKKRLGSEAIEIEWDMRTDYIWRYYKIPSTLIIPKGCERIGDGTFRSCRKLKKVVIPKSVKRIGEWAFNSCRNADIILKKPKRKFKYIGDGAFYYCRDVKEEVRN